MFLEGNGCLVRLVLNYILLYDGYMFVLILVFEKENYLNYIDIFKEEKDLLLFVGFIEKFLLDVYEIYIE